MKPKRARRVVTVLAVLVGVLFLFDTVVTAASYAPEEGYNLPSWLAWAPSAPLNEWFLMESAFGVLFIAFLAFSLVERKNLERGGA